MLKGRITRRLLLWLAIAALPLSAQTKTLTILHSNDLHAHLMPNDLGRGGFARLATAVRQQEGNCTACLYLNAGDLVQGDPVSTIYQGVPVYRIANRLGFNAAVIGNHEFDYGWRKIQEFAKIARYPLLSANVVDPQGRPLTGKAYVIQNVGGLRVAIIGVVLGDLAENFATPDRMGSFKVLPVLETVRKYVKEVRDHSDVILVLGHIHDGTEVDEILRQVPEVSVVVAGHTHTAYPQMKNVDGRVGVLVDGYGTQLGRLDLQVDVAAKKVTRAEWKKIAIDSSIPDDPAVAREVAEWEGKVSKVVDIRIGQAGHRIEGEELRKLIEQAMAEETRSDLAFINRGNVREVIPQGPILLRSIWNALPFDDEVVVGKFKGSQLPPSVTAGRTIDPDREYTLATTDYTAVNQASPDQLNAQGLTFSQTGPVQRDLVIDWIKKKKVLP